MPVHITKQIEFSASHTYGLPGATPEENLRLFGSCVRHHGHNYLLHVTVVGEPDPRTGMVVNVTDLKAAVQDVVATLDHKNLNLDVPAFRGRNPTTEAISLHIFAELTRALAPIRLEAVRLQEDDSLWAEVRDA